MAQLAGQSSLQPGLVLQLVAPRPSQLPMQVPGWVVARLKAAPAHATRGAGEVAETLAESGSVLDAAVVPAGSQWVPGLVAVGLLALLALQWEPAVAVVTPSTSTFQA